jgi:hypothetical protein
LTLPQENKEYLESVCQKLLQSVRDNEVFSMAFYAKMYTRYQIKRMQHFEELTALNSNLVPQVLKKGTIRGRIEKH